MKDSSIALLVIGAILLIVGGATAVGLSSMNNGNTYLTSEGQGFLTVSAAGALIGLVLLIVGVATNKNETRRQETAFRPVTQQSFVCRVCGAPIRFNQKYCGNCGAIPEWGKLQQSFVCKVCGAQVRFNQKYCSNCGRTLEWEVAR